MQDKVKVFIDGSEGTTGLRINERFEKRDDIEILSIDPELRKDPSERGKLISESDYTFLCLPDAASIEAVSLVQNPDTVIIDASTAHRTKDDWAYGLPELSKEYFETEHAAALKELGFVTEEVTELTPEDVQEIGTQWAKRLGTGRSRQYYSVKGKVENTLDL